MKPYFFIPGYKFSNHEKIKQYGVQEIIIDLEDAVKGSDRAGIVKVLVNDAASRSMWMRIPLRNSFEEGLDLTLLREFVAAGYTKIVLPKLASFEELLQLHELISEEAKINVILLVEHPRLLQELELALKSRALHIVGVGLGSHDLMAYLGSRHHLANLEYPRQKLLHAARAYGVEAIDIASMELARSDIFETELSDGFDKGFDGKFIIHPWQLKLLDAFKPYSAEEVAWAKKIQGVYKAKGDALEFNPIVLDGEVIERPHLIRARMIIDKIKRDESK